MGRILFASIAMLLSIAAHASPRGLVILVPGTLNSIAPGDVHFNPISHVIELNPYFSEDVIESFEDRGFEVMVVHDLDPAGDFDENGQTTVDQIRHRYRREFPNGDVPITLLGHSAGGLYSLYAAAHAADLPIRKIFLVATPLGGLELADTVFAKNWFSQALEGACEKTASGFFDLRGLPDLISSRVADFLGGIRLSPSTQLYSLAGSAPEPGPFSLMEAKNLFPFFAFTAHFIAGASDGMVSEASVYSARSIGSIPVTQLRNVDMRLDHAKEVLDYRIFRALGTQHSRYIHSEQRRVYDALAAVAAD